MNNYNSDKSVLKYCKGEVSRIRALTNWKRLKVFAKAIGKLQLIKKNLFLYGTTRVCDYTDIAEKAEEAKLKSWVFDPKSKARRYWNLLINIALFYTTVFLPYQIAFNEYINGSWQYVDDVIDFIFFCDVLVNFNTAKVVNGKVSYSRFVIFKEYLKSWLFLDLISVIPISRIAQLFGEDGKKSINRLIRFLKINRLYRLTKFFYLLNSEKEFKDSNFFSALSVFFCILLTLGMSIHILACIWYYIYDINSDKLNSWDPNSLYTQSDSQYVYLVCVYFVFATLTTIGYGDIVPVNNTEKLYSMFLMMFGVFIYSYLVSSMIKLLNETEESRRLLKEKLKNLKEVTYHLGIDHSLYRKIKINLKLQSHSIKAYKENFYFDFYSFHPSLKNDILEYFYKKAVSEMSFFKAKPKTFCFFILANLNLQKFTKNQCVYSENDFADEIYFIKSGLVSLEIEGYLIRSCVDGEYFGECEILEDCLRSTSAVVISEKADIYSLSKSKYLWVLEEFSYVKKEILNLSKERHKNCTETKSLIRTGSYSRDEQTSDDSNSLNVIRSDTGLAVSLRRNDTAKKKNRKIWAMASGKHIYGMNDNVKKSLSLPEISVTEVEENKRRQSERVLFYREVGSFVEGEKIEEVEDECD